MNYERGRLFYADGDASGRTGLMASPVSWGRYSRERDQGHRKIVTAPFFAYFRAIRSFRCRWPWRLSRGLREFPLVTERPTAGVQCLQVAAEFV